jgi:hypothetical protein
VGEEQALHEEGTCDSNSLAELQRNGGVNVSPKSIAEKGNRQQKREPMRAQTFELLPGAARVQFLGGRRAAGEEKKELSRGFP